LKLEHQKLLSTFAYSFNLRLYSEAEVVMGGGRDGAGSGGGAADDADERPGCRAFGPALEAVLTWLGAEGVESTDSGAPGGGSTGSAGELRHPSVRVLSFLAGLPDLGDGALSAAR